MRPRDIFEWRASVVNCFPETANWSRTTSVSRKQVWTSLAKGGVGFILFNLI